MARRCVATRGSVLGRTALGGSDTRARETSRRNARRQTPKGTRPKALAQRRSPKGTRPKAHTPDPERRLLKARPLTPPRLPSSGVRPARAADYVSQAAWQARGLCQACRAHYQQRLHQRRSHPPGRRLSPALSQGGKGRGRDEARLLRAMTAVNRGSASLVALSASVTNNKSARCQWKSVGRPRDQNNKDGATCCSDTLWNATRAQEQACCLATTFAVVLPLF